MKKMYNKLTMTDVPLDASLEVPSGPSSKLKSTTNKPTIQAIGSKARTRKPSSTSTSARSKTSTSSSTAKKKTSSTITSAAKRTSTTTKKKVEEQVVENEVNNSVKQMRILLN